MITLNINTNPNTSHAMSCLDIGTRNRRRTGTRRTLTATNTVTVFTTASNLSGEKCSIYGSSVFAISRLVCKNFCFLSAFSVLKVSTIPVPSEEALGSDQSRIQACWKLVRCHLKNVLPTQSHLSCRQSALYHQQVAFHPTSRNTDSLVDVEVVDREHELGCVLVATQLSRSAYLPTES